ncbi:cytochrome P450 [Echria macrotheca]|uniref:Cytochrome P450 n=1 Tax=Echria macrotheca TaxID=438768 RepID=A0AAJ0FD41_9PEZI|nr:cytochrome P450 [Echria macrotheca]
MAALVSTLAAMQWTTLVLLLGAVLLATALSVAVYRLFLHPLASVPGPPLAAVTRLYAFYFNIVKKGTFYLEIERLHEIYGPVVRIAPNEIHLSDPDNYDKIYAVGSKLYKDPVFYGVLDPSELPAMFATTSNEIHRRRRAPLEPFFSRRNVLTLEDVIQNKVERLCGLVENSVSRGEGVDLWAAFRAVSVDVITEYAFDDCWGQLEREDLGDWFSVVMVNSGIAMWFLQQWPFLLTLMDKMPQGLVKKMDPGMGDMLALQERTRKLVENVERDIKAGRKPRQRTIFHDLLDPEVAALNQRQVSIEEMAAEAYAMCAAAAETTGNAMTAATYHVVTNPKIYSKLREELLAMPVAFGDKLSYAELEKRSYLTGVVKEGLRLSYGVIGRLPRVLPQGGGIYNGYHLPEGTVVGMSSYMQHRNPSAFPNPNVFDPERWINIPPAAVAAQNKCLVPFSKGSRGCIGQNLAMCEMYVTLGTLFHRFGDLTAEDVGELVYMDYFNAFNPTDQNLRVFRKREKA